jgi:hypothetical protein
VGERAQAEITENEGERAACVVAKVGHALVVSLR